MKPMTEKAKATLPGTVEKIVKARFPGQCEKAEIAVDGGDHLYRELRIENILTNEKGEEVHLKEGAKVEVTIKAGPEAITSEK
jgi:hypothetical protein